MKAIYFDKHGGLDVLQYGDLPDPVAKPGEILVDIHAASINAADAKVREGGTYGNVPFFPYVLGRDFSGVVAALGDGVTDFKVGDPVFGVCPQGQEGTYCEKIAVKADICARKPDAVSHAEAATLALTGLTAIISVEETLGLKPGETILVQGGAGGVAGYAIQLAKHIGAKVITTASAANHDYVKGLGADQVIDYRKEDFTRIGQVCDCAFDTVGGDVALKTFQVIKPGGRAAFIASGANAPASPRADVQSLRPKVGRSRAHLERIMALHKSGAIKLPEIHRFPLAKAVDAQRISEGRHFRGKLILDVR
jgi:NADPH:quinone reductase-like Zn-dependent oxidoreductase